MSGRAGRNCGGCSSSGCGGRGRSRGQNYTGARSASKKGLCTTLGSNIFDYGHKGAANQMRTSWEKLVQFVGTNYGQDISNELQNKITVTLPEPTHIDAVMQHHMQHEQMIRNAQAKLSVAHEQQCILLEAAVAAQLDADAPMKLAVLENEIVQAEFEVSEDVPIELTDSEKTQHSNEWRTY
jgi:hypothetical protein